MTTLTLNTNTTNLCSKGHTPHLESVSLDNSNFIMIEYTFCEVCENNIDRFFVDDDYDCLPYWSKWSITK